MNAWPAKHRLPCLFDYFSLETSWPPSGGFFIPCSRETNLRESLSHSQKTMAKKITLGNRPESIKRVVTFPLPEGEEGAIEAQFKYRTRVEFGRLIDDVFQPAEAEPPFKDGKFSMELQQAQICETNADYLFRILVGWNLDVPFSREACLQLALEVPSAAQALMEKYREACLEGRLGN